MTMSDRNGAPASTVKAFLVAGMVAITQSAFGQTTNDPFPTPINTANAIVVNYQDFATVPDDSGEAPRLMTLVDEPGTRRLFVNTMRGRLHTISYDGKTVTPYLDINDARWGIPVQSQGRERGVQSFTLHPQFGRQGTPGYGKFYTYTDTSNTAPAADFAAPAGNRTHDTVLLEWSAKTAAASAYDGGPPREIFRAAQPFPNHNGGQIAFNTLAAAGSADAGLLYVGLADGGSGGDPMNMAQNLGLAFGKILRIDPLGTNSSNGRYGIPPSNPFVSDGRNDTLGEIYAYGVRNPQRFSWDAKTGAMYVADIGQNMVEEISPVTAGANLGWNKWEGSFAYVDRQVSTQNQRADKTITYPVVEFDHRDPLFQRAAVTGVYVNRQGAIKPLANLLIFGDNPSGEIFAVSADNLPHGGQDAMRRVMLNDKGTPKTLLQLIRERNAAQGRPAAPRADLRLGVGPEGQIFVLNKADGIIRLLVP